MIDLIAMRPSEWKEMPERLSSESFRADLGKALSHFLRLCKNDGGSGADEIYMTGVKLAHAGVWNYISAKQAANMLETTDTGVSSVFLDSIPDDFRLDIQQELHSLDSRRSKRQGKIRGRFSEAQKRRFATSMVKRGSRSKRLKKA